MDRARRMMVFLRSLTGSAVKLRAPLGRILGSARRVIPRGLRAGLHRVGGAALRRLAALLTPLVVVLRALARPLTRTRRRKIVSGAALAVVVAAAVSVGAVLRADKPPLARIEEARAALGKARQTRADLYAPRLLRKAEFNLDAALAAWRVENARMKVQRDFHRTREYTEESRRLSKLAGTRAVAVRDSLKLLAQASIRLVRSDIESFTENYGGLPVDRSLRRKLSRGRLLLRESELALKRRDYWAAAAKAQAAEVHVGDATTHTQAYIKNYLAAVPKWKKWAEETILWSTREKAPAIIVDKIGGVCRVYVSGRLKAEYAIELGPNWLGDKRHRGDNKTPEGKYRITKKRGHGETKYYRALEINYPNEDDLRQFRAAKKRGEIPKGAGIGSLIEIHGEGGQGRHWTSGCVALRNEDIDELFALARVGTPVTIVGALAPSANGNGNGNGKGSNGKRVAQSTPRKRR